MVVVDFHPAATADAFAHHGVYHAHQIVASAYLQERICTETNHSLGQLRYETNRLLEGVFIRKCHLNGVSEVLGYHTLQAVLEGKKTYHRHSHHDANANSNPDREHSHSLSRVARQIHAYVLEVLLKCKRKQNTRNARYHTVVFNRQEWFFIFERVVVEPVYTLLNPENHNDNDETHNRRNTYLADTRDFGKFPSKNESEPKQEGQSTPDFVSSDDALHFWILWAISLEQPDDRIDY